MTYWRGHSAFCVDAGKGKYDLFEDPFAWSKTFWVLTHPAIKFFFASTEGINHRAGFDVSRPISLSSPSGRRCTCLSLFLGGENLVVPLCRMGDSHYGP